jgi:hypothetical protein
MQRSLVGCFVALAISLATIPAAGAEIRIGLAAPLTGPLAWAGETRAGAGSCARPEYTAAAQVKRWSR